jgi:putative ABC transport system permease protein
VRQRCSDFLLAQVVESFAITISIMLLLGVEKVRFGVRGGNIQLLLYSVFRTATQRTTSTGPASNTSPHILRSPDRPAVARRQPSELPRTQEHDRLLSTRPYRQAQGVTFRAGWPFSDLFDAVIGADVGGAWAFVYH